MTIRKCAILALFILSVSARPLYAAEHEPPQVQNEPTPQPTLSENPAWASKLLLGVLAAFILAIGVGAISKYLPNSSPAPEPPQEDHAHDAHHP